MFFPTEYRYTKNHQWLAIDGSHIGIGLTVYAEHQAGTLSFIEFPNINQSVQQGDELFVLETVKASVSVKSPVDGIVTDINSQLDNDPRLFHVDPFEYWFVELEVKQTPEVQGVLDGFLTAVEYETFLKEEM